MKLLKLLEATPWPKDSLQHEVPVTSLERWVLLTVLNEIAAPKNRDEERSHADLFAQFERDWDFDTVKVTPEQYNEVARVKITRAMVSTIGDVYEAALRKELKGRLTRSLAALVQRVEWAAKTEAEPAPERIGVSAQ